MISPEQCRAARAWLGWSQDELAATSGVSLSTIRDFENEKRWEPIGHNYKAIQRALEDAGILFVAGTDGQPGIRYDLRIKERDVYKPMLTLLQRAPEGFLKTADLIKSLTGYFAPDGKDAEILANRSDTRFSQIVRNVVSHRDVATNIIGIGFAAYDKARRGLQITDAGRAALRDDHPILKNEP